MNIGFIDYCHPKKGFANRDQTGGFGSGMYASGIVGNIISKLKKQLRIPVLTLGYLNAIAKQADHSTTIYTNLPTKEEDIIIIATSMIHYDLEIELAIQIKKAYPSTIIGFIGPFVSEMPQLFEQSSDFIIIGEAEDIFHAICVGSQKPSGIIKAKTTVDIEKLPFPNWDGFDINSYSYAPTLPRKPFATIQGSRGCPFACEFCPYLVLQDVPLRRRSNESIVNEIEYLISTYHIQSLLFRDITWSMNKKLTKELCKMIISRNFNLGIGVETRADTLDDELIQLMSEAGVKSVNLGIESPDDDIVIGSGRVPIKENKLISVIQKMEKFGIKIQAFYILGLIDDTHESMQRTIAYSQYLNTFTAQFCVLTPYPGTKTFTDLKDRLITEDFRQFTEYNPVVRLDNIDANQITNYLNKAYNSYYLRGRWLVKHGLTAAKGFLRF